MQQVTSDIMTFRGSHFELGVKTGKWLQQTPLLKNREKEWKKRVPRFDIDVNETYQIFQTYAPGNDNLIMYTFDCLNMYNF
ncbi:hypothetical protein XD03_14180 [Staphylococcus aureus]|nr:hypothetical protein [Staphylococcus aureus]